MQTHHRLTLAMLVLGPLGCAVPAGVAIRAPSAGDVAATSTATSAATSAPATATVATTVADWSAGESAFHPVPPRPAGAAAEPRDAAIAKRRAYFLPGGGHFYTGETGKGAVLLGVAGGALVAGALLSSDGSGGNNFDDPNFECDYDFETHTCKNGRNWTPLLVGAAVAAGSWVYGIMDAGPSAVRINARNGVGIGPVQATPKPLLARDRRGETVLGLGMRLSW